MDNQEKMPAKAMDDHEEGMEDATTTEFVVRRSELMANVKAGAYGRLIIPVKVLDVGDGKVYLQKDGEIKVDGEFSDSEPLDSMKRRLGTAEDR